MPADRKIPGSQAPAIRLNKWLADTGVCSRREADAWISAGRVRVNDGLPAALGDKIHPAVDRVFVDGALLATDAASAVARTYWAFHKPLGVVTTRRDERDRRTIYDCLPPECQDCDPAGRLDRQSSGLLILSNDGDFIYRLTHPRFHVEKQYRVTFDRAVPSDLAVLFRQGVPLAPEGRLARAERAERLGPDTLALTLVTGYNRQIRRMAQALGYNVAALKRVAVGPVKLGALATGDVRALSRQEVQRLQKAFQAVQKPSQA